MTFLQETRLIYLLDASGLIEAHRRYYPLHRIPEFWKWLSAMGERGLVKIPPEIVDEIVLPQLAAPDPLATWLQERPSLQLQEEVSDDLLRQVIRAGYGVNLSDDAFHEIGADPYLVAHGLADAGSRVIVTNEQSKPGRQGANRHIPDVCQAVNIRCINLFQLIEELDFRTDWRSRQP